MLTKIKICGLKRPEDIIAVNKYEPEYAGFVFAGTKRRITDEIAGSLKGKLRGNIKAIGVFVNEPIEHIAALTKAGVIDGVQLHGDETREYVRKLRIKTDAFLIKAFRIKGNEESDFLEGYETDYFLFDSYNESQYGGTGKTFDWTFLQEIKKPFFLAGGLHEGNVQEAIQVATPYAVDISSGVETNGVKEEEKIKRIIEKVRKGCR